MPVELMLAATVVYGTRGTGKTVFGSVVAEEVHKRGQRFVAIDLKGDWWGLKSSADGKSEAIPIVIFGGDHADVPLEEGSGDFIGKTVAGIAASCVLDLEHMSKGKQVKFLTDFFLSLYHNNREPLLVIADEAQRYCPQMSRASGDGGQISVCIGAVEDLVKLGRKHGLGVVLITQRGSGLNKEVSELCDVLVAFRSPGPRDQERVAEWLEANTTEEQANAVMPGIAKMPNGTAIVASGNPSLPVFGVHAVRMRETFDSSKTPEIGKRKVEPSRLAKPDLTALQEQMKDAIERAKDSDPKELRARVRTLERDLEHQKERERHFAEVLGVPDGGQYRNDWDDRLKALMEKPAEPIEIPMILPEDLKRFETAIANLQNANATVVEIGQGIHARIYALKSADQGGHPVVPTYEIGKDKPTSFGSRQVQSVQRSEGATSLPQKSGGAEQRILDALSELSALGVPQPDRVQVALLAGYSNLMSKGFANSISALRTAGKIDYPSSGTVILTDAGRKVAAKYPRPRSPAEIQERIIALLGGAHEKLLRPLVQIYPKAMSREDLGRAAGYSNLMSKGFANSVSRLSSLGLVKYPARGFVQAAPVLFLE